MQKTSHLPLSGTPIRPIHRLIPLLFVLGGFYVLPICAYAQGPHFNHTTVYVTDLQKSADFYEKVIELTKLAEPFHDGKHVWFSLGNHGQLHVVSGAKQVSPHDINIHLAFSIHPLEPFLKHLDEAGVKYGNWAGDSKSPQVRPDGIKQVYLQDPDGYWLEINDDNF